MAYKNKNSSRYTERTLFIQHGSESWQKRKMKVFEKQYIAHRGLLITNRKHRRIPSRHFKERYSRAMALNWMYS